jgi:SAM-dependent methyltransferase
MNVQPGMSVADIGAGTGYLTFPIAQTMRNTGTVFATDIDPRRLASLKEEASRRELSNISPVPVRPDGLDSFYTRQTFDIILICEVSGLLSGKGSSDYFNGLRPSLKQDTGRLFILELTDIPDFDRLVRESLTFWNDHSPVFKRLRPENREYVKNWKHGPLPAERARILIEDFRKIIRDPSFPRDTASYFSDKGNYPFFLGMIP